MRLAAIIEKNSTHPVAKPAVAYSGDTLGGLKAENVHNLNITTVMLSGDKQAVVDDIAKVLDIDEAYCDLLPDGKVDKVQTFKMRECAYFIWITGLMMYR